MRIFITLFLLLLLVLSLSLSVDASAMKLHDEALTRSFAAFGLAKALNAVISLFQGTELSFTPVGIGLNFSVGEVLDPFNDIVERFSWVMLFASVSLGIQKLLLLLSAKLFLQLLLGLSIVISVVLIWVKRVRNTQLLVYSLKAMILLLLLRFSAVLFVYTSQLIYVSVLETEYENASKVIEKTQIELENLENKNRAVLVSQKDTSFFDGVSSKYDKIVENLNVSKQLNSLQGSIDEASSKIITMITIFTFGSILMPLLYFWFMIVSIRVIFKTDFNREKLKLLYND